MESIPNSEREAIRQLIVWAKKSYKGCQGGWKRLLKTYDEYMASWPGNCTKTQWSWWYNYPFGRPDDNDKVQRIHYYFNAGKITREGKINKRKLEVVK